ncbi:hypothetical protein CR205_03050 [Alteribacter lacisalsi]|uniref:Uncharacterized protein n=1 Tax=Alteribacter lacisalsi TaxID=2045244 RepID=A0A2W0H8U9_9BACI|nr:hypothetical protein [Alteribacter lacisalsi]PYZ97587.1 hypothetical protein CR205_03050 [Alteribacter lacisalsi]
MEKKEILLKMLELTHLTEEKVKAHRKRLKVPLGIQPEEIIKKLEEYQKIVELKVPTKNDLAALAALIRQVEEKVDALEEKLLTQDCRKKEKGKKRKDNNQ